ncbi:zinc finger protein 32 [Paraphaeosphaeria sporulosa]
MYDNSLPCQDICLRSHAKEPSAQHSAYVISVPRQPFTELHASSDASLAAPPYAATIHGTRFESNNSSAKWRADAIYSQSKLEALDRGGLSWSQRSDATSPTFNLDFDLDSTQSDWWSPVDSIDAFSGFESLSPFQPCAQPEIDGRLYDPNIEYEPWNCLPSTSLTQANHDQERSDSAGLFGRFSQSRKRAFEEAPPCTGTNESFQLLDHTSSTPYLGFKSGCQLSSLNNYSNNTVCAPCDGTATDREPSSHTAYEPGIDFPSDVDSKLSCHYIDCGKRFANAADCKRHFNTFHNVDRQSYRCAHDGCIKAYKVWNRLDSFRKHAKRHHLDDSQMKALMQRSRNREHNGLHFALTTQKGLSKIGPNELVSRLTKSHILLSDETNIRYQV